MFFLQDVFSQLGLGWLLSVVSVGMLLHANDNNSGGGDSGGGGGGSDGDGDNDKDSNDGDDTSFDDLKSKIGDDAFQKIASHFVVKGRTEGRTKTQKEVERIKNERNQTLERLKSIEARLQGESKEKQLLQQTITEYEEKMMTKEQLAEKEKRAAEQEYANKLKVTQENANLWEQQYDNLFIQSAILKAASSDETKAFSPSQIVDLVKPYCYKEEVIDDDGNKTGKYKVKLKVYDDDQQEYLPYDFADGWKKWADKKENDNLFVSRLASGSDDGTKRLVRANEVTALDGTYDDYKKKREQMWEQMK